MNRKTIKNIQKNGRHHRINQLKYISFFSQSNKDMGEEDAIAIAGAVKTNISLQRFDLNTSNVKDEGAKAFA